MLFLILIYAENSLLNQNIAKVELNLANWYSLLLGALQYSIYFSPNRCGNKKRASNAIETFSASPGSHNRAVDYFCLFKTFNNYCAIVRNLLQLNANQKGNGSGSAAPFSQFFSMPATKIVYMLNCACWGMLAPPPLSLLFGSAILCLPFGNTFFSYGVLCGTQSWGIGGVCLSAPFCLRRFFGGSALGTMSSMSIVVSSCGGH